MSRDSWLTKRPGEATTSTLSAARGAIWRARPTHRRASGHGPPLGAMGVAPVPGLERGRRRPGETLAPDQWRWNVRMTYLVLVWGGFAAGCAVGPRPFEVTGIFLVPVLVCTLPLGLEILAEAIRRSLMRLESADPAARRAAWRAVAFEALAAALLTGSTIAGAMLLIERSAHVTVYSPRIFWGITLVFELLTLPALAGQVRSKIAQIRQFDQWDGLDLSLDA